MASNYNAIRNENKRRYGTDIGRIGPMLLSDRYDDRIHFIYELLQNAEDALARRPLGWNGSRSVAFHLGECALRVSHFGQPFNEADVRGICGIAESTKDHTAIGRFGIGFKSVYAFTERPEIHSGQEDFAIENFVWPVGVEPAERNPDETLIIVPFKLGDCEAAEEIARGLQQLGRTSLLFLRQIEEINWSVPDGNSGVYLRESQEIDAEVRRITVIGQEQCEAEADETWLVFSRPMNDNADRLAGHVEIAFTLVKEDNSEHELIQPVQRSPLVVFFPTALETHLGFLAQGPYRTTPSRDNVPRNDPWNQRLVDETASLLVEALRWLRDHDLLDTRALHCLPLDQAKFRETMFTPLFEVTKQALLAESLLPRFDAGHIAATYARLARTQELRDLFKPQQLADLFGREGKLVWLSGDITQDRTPELRRYLMTELDVDEVIPEAIIRKLDKRFLKARSDKWILKLYEFLNGQPALRSRLHHLPLIRLKDGTQVVAHRNGQPQAFLPGKVKTGFPIVRAAVCASKAAREFLRSLELTEPDPVDDVIWNVLPKYHKEEIDVSRPDYESDIRRILTAFATDSKGQREKLLEALSETTFVMAVDVGDGSKRYVKPSRVYLATERLKELFTGVADVLLVDDTYACLRGEDIREMLEACGAVRYLRPVEDNSLSWQECRKLRIQAGHAETSGQNDQVTDWTLSGLDELFESLPSIDTGRRLSKARLLWEELAHLEERRGKVIFTGEYTWTHYGSYRKTFPAAFVRKLNKTAWIPDGNGELQRPEFVLFDTLGWKPNPLLQSKIHFKQPIIETLAQEAGIEPGVLDLLKRHGITSQAVLLERLGLMDEPPAAEEDWPDSVEDALEKLLGDAPAPTPPVPDPVGPEPSGLGDTSDGTRRGDGAGSNSGGGDRTGARGGGQESGRAKGSESGAGKRIPSSNGSRPFISYVGVHSDEEAPDLDGLDQSARMALEAKAIELILSNEPQWQRTNMHNPGFDLFEAGEDGKPKRWCEVKAMAGSLLERPVGLSLTQFECAREHGEAYWLYIVEHAGDASSRVVRIQDPAGKARTFTFDHGWLSITDTDSEQGED
jgi:hypothetical protein